MSPPLWVLSSAVVYLMVSRSTFAAEPETCFSRQHQNAIINVRQALNTPATVMDARVVRSERDCVLACCSEELKPGERTAFTQKCVKSMSGT